MPPTGQAQRYAQVWEIGLYEGFSENTSARDSTPLLEELIANLQKQRNIQLGERGEKGIPIPVIEAGAGLGSHALRLVQEGFSVIANEYSELATREIEHKRGLLTLPAQARLQIAQGDILDCLRTLAEESIAGFYAHSLLHTFSDDERKRLYAEIKRVQPRGGIIAVSFKAHGDYVQNENGNSIKQTEAGPVITDHAGRISRLFVTNTSPLVRELEDADYQVFDTYWWDVPKNNPENKIEYRKFVGLIAQKTNGERR